MPSVRLRRCQESDLGMAECPLLTWSSVHSRQHPLGEYPGGMFRQLVRIRAGHCSPADRLPPTAESEIQTKQPPFFHSPTRTIPRSVTEHTTVRHRGYHSDGSWCTPSGACPGRGCRIVGAGVRNCATPPPRLFRKKPFPEAEDMPCGPAKKGRRYDIKHIVPVEIL